MRIITNMDTGQTRWADDFLVALSDYGKKIDGKNHVDGPISPDVLQRVLDQCGFGGINSVFIKFKRIDETKWVAGMILDKPRFVFTIERCD